MSEHRFTLPGTTAPEVLVRTKALGFPEVVVDGLAIPRQVRGGRSVWEIPVGGGTRTLEQWKKFRFATKLGELGWTEGKNLAVELAFADGFLDRLPALAAALRARGFVPSRYGL